jgi:hypothetical protein
MKIGQVTNNKPRGRPRIANAEDLLRYEALWVYTFRGLRDGDPETEVETRGTSGMLMKVSGQEKLLIMREQDREKVHITLPGKPPRTLRQPKFTSTPGEMESWHSRVREEQKKFRRVTMGHETTKTKVPALPAERNLWEALKRACTGAQVRRIYSLSKLWLTPRIEFPEGGHMELWTYRRALYKHAHEFCQAKLDSRYPGRDKRESGDYRRIEHLARVMAGLSLAKPIAPSYSIELFRKMKHLRRCRCWRCILKIAPRYRCSLARLLSQSRLPAQG